MKETGDRLQLFTPPGILHTTDKNLKHTHRDKYLDLFSTFVLRIFLVLIMQF